MPLAPADAAKLTKLLGMLGSDHDGEVAAAGRAANRLLKAHGLTWSDVITPAPQSATLPAVWREPEHWLDAVGLCLVLPDAPLSSWDRKFLISISQRDADLTEKQQAQLIRIVDKCREHA